MIGCAKVKGNDFSARSPSSMASWLIVLSRTGTIGSSGTVVGITDDLNIRCVP